MGVRSGLQRRQLRRLAGLAQHQPQRLALDHAVQHLRLAQGAPQRLAAVAGYAAQLHAAAFHAADQFAGRAGVSQLSGVHQQHLVAALGFVQIGGAPQHGHAVRGQLAHHLPQLAAGNRIDADAGLVQQQDPRLAQQRAGQAQLLLHAAGQLAGRPRGEAGEVGEGQQALEAVSAALADDAAQIGVQLQVLLHRQVFVQTELLRHIADQRAQRVAVGDRVQALDADGAGAGLQQAGQQPQQGGLAGAVRPGQAGDRAAAYRRVDAGQRLVRAEALAEAAEDDGVQRVHLSRRPPALPSPACPGARRRPGFAPPRAAGRPARCADPGFPRSWG